MRWWDLSARFQMAIASVQFDNETSKRESESDVEPAQEFIQRNKESAKGLRANLWPQWKDRNGNPRHPPRWTGSNDIRADIVKADSSQFREVIRENLNQTLLHYYSSEYQHLNKTIHSSGFLGVEGSPQQISSRAAFGCWASASLAMICHQIISIDRGLDISEVNKDWAYILKVRMIGFIYHVGEIESETI